MLEAEKCKQDETKRFYLQQKSVRKECNYGAKNCTTCANEDCQIRQFVEN